MLSRPLCSKSLLELAFEATVLEITARTCLFFIRRHCAATGPSKSLLDFAFEATERQNPCSGSLSKPLCSKSLLELAFEATVLEITARTCLFFLRRHCAATGPSKSLLDLDFEATEHQNHCSSSLSRPLCSKSLLGLAYLSFGVTLLFRTRTVFSN